MRGAIRINEPFPLSLGPSIPASAGAIPRLNRTIAYKVVFPTSKACPYGVQKPSSYQAKNFRAMSFKSYPPHKLSARHKDKEVSSDHLPLEMPFIGCCRTGSQDHQRTILSCTETIFQLTDCLKLTIPQSSSLQSRQPSKFVRYTQHINDFFGRMDSIQLHILGIFIPQVFEYCNIAV